MKERQMILTVLAAISLLSGCGKRYVPKPRGYFRIDLPEAQYKDFATSEKGMGEYPYTFEQSVYAQAAAHPESGEQYWIDLYYPDYNARIHCSYKRVDKNIRELSDDAQRFVYNHAGKATSIPEQGYENEEERVYGVFYELRGNTASPYQFYLTDSTRNFFRGALYFDCIPNQDSLAPVTARMQEDIRHMIETFRWK